MICLTGQEIDQLIREDIPYFDLTSWALGIGTQPGKISYFTREDAVVCGTEEVCQIFERLCLHVDSFVPSGQKVKAGDILLSGSGDASNLHMAWKVCQNILDHCSGIATKTEKMVASVRIHNSSLPIYTTRKSFPGAKALSIKAILAGGALPHRLGLSETILIFKQHMNFIGGLEGLICKIPEIKKACSEKRIIVEATTFEEAKLLCQAGVDGIQFDKMKSEQLKQISTQLKETYPRVILLAAGGINESNIGEFTKMDIDGIVTTSLYNANPIDVGVNIQCCG